MKIIQGNSRASILKVHFLSVFGKALENLHYLVHGGPSFRVIAQTVVSQFRHLLHMLACVLTIHSLVNDLQQLSVADQERTGPLNKVVLATGPVLIHHPFANQQL